MEHHKQQDETALDAAPAGATFSRGRRRLVSVLLVLHLAAVFAPPFAFASGPNGGSPFASFVMQILRPYIDAAYLNHGYFFFAPNPGASHLLRYELTMPDGTTRPPEVMPNLDQQWPRLLYHRHFMLTEQLHARFVPPEAPPELAEDAERLAVWQRERRLYEAMLEGYRQHLMARSGAEHATLVRVEHRPPSPYEFLQGTSLNDPTLYVDLPETLPRRSAP